MALFAREAEWRPHCLVNCGAKKHPTSQSFKFYLCAAFSCTMFLFSIQQKVSLSFVAILVPLTDPAPDFKTQMADFFPLNFQFLIEH